MAPSRFINPASFDYCREIRRDEIARVVDQFGQAAEIAVVAGFDAVELHFGHLYLPSSFLSPLINRRKDDYGGSIENRSRFVREIAQRVRETVGDRVAVTAKLNMVDGMRGGIWLAEALRTAQLLDEDGNLDAIELTEGSSVYKPLYLFRGDVPADDFAKVLPQPQSIGVRLFGKWAMGNYEYRDLYMLDNARQFIPVVTDTKLILLGGINNRDHMVTGLREGFDFLALGRALLREPDLVNKLMDDPSRAGPLQPQQQVHGHRLRPNPLRAGSRPALRHDRSRPDHLRGTQVRQSELTRASKSRTSRHVSSRALAPSARFGIVMNPWMAPS